MFKELVEYIVKSLVDEPDQVDISEIFDEDSLIIELRVADDDKGRVIGRGGRVINAIRTLIEPLADKENKHVTLEVI